MTLSKEDLVAIGELLDAKLAGIKEDIAAIKKDTGHLMATNPPAVMLKKKIPVVVWNSVKEGATSTWTYMIKTQGDGTELFLAVSCEHCALPYKIKDDDTKVFVSLPKELIDVGIKWVGLLPEYVQGPDSWVERWAERRRGKDISIVLLDNFPDWVERTGVPVWPDAGSHAPASRNMVGGTSNTGIVSGGYIARTYRPIAGTTQPSVVTFVEDSGEPGNSGTLMYELVPGAEDLPILGVYCGVSNNHSHLKERGEICPLPAVNAFQKHDLVDGNGCPDLLTIRVDLLPPAEHEASNHRNIGNFFGRFRPRTAREEVFKTERFKKKTKNVGRTMRTYYELDSEDCEEYGVLVDAVGVAGVAEPPAETGGA